MKKKLNLPAKTNPVKVTFTAPKKRSKFHAGHRVEEHVKVYLTLSEDGTHWEIDPINADGFPLDGLQDGPQVKESDCACGKSQECEETHSYAAKQVELPTGKEVFLMLAEFFGRKGSEV